MFLFVSLVLFAIGTSSHTDFLFGVFFFLFRGLHSRGAGAKHFDWSGLLPRAPWYPKLWTYKKPS